MNKEELIVKLNGEISNEAKSEYLLRLGQLYYKNGSPKIFLEQYMNGDGKELKKKFWSRHSSSRIAFDLYSCLANDKSIEDFEFEYQLPGILYKNKEFRKPNMDVYYKQNQTVYFIESKFTESPKETLPEAYYIKQDQYNNSKKTKIVKESIANRYRGNNRIALVFSDFCLQYLPFIDNKNKADWFDYKQELCHLFGILFFGIEKLKETDIKIINFRNIVYDFDDYQSLGQIHISSTALDFINKAETLVNQIFQEEKLNIQFVYNYDFIQNIAKEYANKIGFGTNKSIKDLMKQYCL